ncbi:MULTISPECIES: hypothetical protein [unclassified Candidatus Tisiphia]|uniref:hypothetical protein n=1 Tax=unclassified Candidatus Tisiphia TaxID=2996318 RepID=UPI00312C929D
MPKLSFNQIIEALKAGKDVKAIDLKYEDIGAEGAKALAHALENNNTVTTIDLWGNKIGDELLNDIRDKLEKNKLQAEALQSKEIEQGVDSVQEKLLATNIGSEKKQEISKKMQQIKKSHKSRN